MDSEILNKILSKKILWVEIKAQEKEYYRLCNQIEQLEQAKRNISSVVIKKVEEIQKISDWLLEREYEALKDLPQP